MSRFEGKVAIITGASTGLGPVMATMMAAEGARLVLASRRLELVEEVAAAIGPAAIAVRADVTDARGGVTDVSNTVTIYEFDDVERIRHLGVYVMPLEKR